jgi:hypothetical protein
LVEVEVPYLFRLVAFLVVEEYLLEEVAYFYLEEAYQSLAVVGVAYLELPFHREEVVHLVVEE